MASELAIALAATLVEYEYLVTLDEWNKNFENNFCAFYSWSTNLYNTVVVSQQHFLNLNSCTSLHILHVMNVEFLAFLYLELLTLNFCNYVHFVFNCFRVESAGEAPCALAFPSLSDINRLQRYGFFAN